MPINIPDSAPFTGNQKFWLQGFLDGILSSFAPVYGNSATVSEPSGGLPVTILWGSQTGNSEGLAKKLAKSLAAKGHSPGVKDMAEITPQDLTVISHLCLITSTYGDGEPPDNAAAFHAALHADGAPSLESMNFSVFALGDSNYPEFCKCGRDFDQRLATLGAKRIAPIVECDVDYDEPFASWLSQLTAILKTA
jgi:sulfite reductase (NADPH) flavoprotein alpha-component